MSSTHDNTGHMDSAAVELVTFANTWQLRFDIPVDPSSDEIARDFAKSWTELLEAQKLTSVVSSTSHPLQIKVQVCTAADEDNHWTCEASEVVDLLKKLSKKATPDIETECIIIEPGEWQGFKLWMTFEREQAEKFFDRKKTKKRFTSRVFKKIYSET